MKNCLGTGILILVLLAGIGGGFTLIQSGMNSDSVSSIIWGSLLTIICTFLLIGQLILSDRIHISNKTKVWVLFAVPVAVLAAVFTISWLMLQNRRPPAGVLSALSEACEHHGVAAAAIYDAADRDHPRIVVLSADGSIHTWTSEADPEWRPASMDQVQLVVCLGEIGRSVTDTCTTQHGTIKMQVEEMYVEIVAAKSGEVLATSTVAASPPPECPIQGGFYKPSEWRDRVTFLNYQDVESFITTFLVGQTTNINPISTPALQSEQSVSPVEEQAASESDEVGQAIIGVVSVSSARVRSGPGTQYLVVAGLRSGEQVTILGRNPDDTWYQIELSGGTSGWASAELLQLQDEGQEIPLVEDSGE